MAMTTRAAHRGIASGRAARASTRWKRSSVTAYLIIAFVFVGTAVDLITRGTAVGPDSISYLPMAGGLRQLAATHWSGVALSPTAWSGSAPMNS